MSTVSMASLPEISPRRRRTDKIMRGSISAATLLALVPLVLIIYYLLKQGLGSLSGSFFSSDPNGNFFGSVGGIKSAIFGTLEMIALASLIAIPIGIGVALYLVEYGKDSWFANLVRYFIDVMTGVPSIVFGLFIYISLVVNQVGGVSFAGWKGSVAVALLMLPVVARSAEVVLMLVPDSLREAALALGAPRWRVVWRVVLPTAIPGLVTGSLLSVARGMGETAPLLFTAGATFIASANLNQQMNSLPLQIYTDITNPRQAVDRPCLGRGAHAGRDHPDSELDCPHRFSKEPHGMIPPETTSKEPTDMSTAGGPSEPSMAAPRPSASPPPANKTGHGVSVKGLNAYYGSQHSIKDVTIDFPANEVTAIIGPSGSGKSTVVRCINRMHEEIPGARAEGAVMLDELDVYEKDVDVTAVRRLIGMVFQKPNPFPTMSIFDNVAAGLRLTGTRSGDLPQLVEHSLQSVGCGTR